MGPLPSLHHTLFALRSNPEISFLFNPLSAGSTIAPFTTSLTNWYGSLSSAGSAYPRPGNLYQDSISATSLLDPTFFTAFHKWGLDWNPGQWLRWYIDDQLVYEVILSCSLGHGLVLGVGVYFVADNFAKHTETAVFPILFTFKF